MQRLQWLIVALLSLALPLQASAAKSELDRKLQAICKKYEGQPIFDSDGHTSYATCDWVHTIAGSANSPILSYRKILSASHTLAELKQAPGLPPDMKCGDIRTVGNGQEMLCEADMRVPLPMPILFSAKGDGSLVGVEMSLDYREADRLAAEDAVRRGSITRFYDAFVGVVVQASVARWESQVGPDDHFEFDGSTVKIYVARPAD